MTGAGARRRLMVDLRRCALRPAADRASCRRFAPRPEAGAGPVPSPRAGGR